MARFMRWLVAGVALTLMLAGCTSSAPNNTDGTLDGDEETVDCGPLLEEFATMTQEEYDGLPEDEQLPEECADQFVPYIPPLTHVEWIDCTYFATQVFVPETAWGPAPEGMEYIYVEHDGAQVITVVGVGVECAEFTYRNGTSTNMRFYTQYTPIEPMDGWEDTDYLHYWMNGLVTNDATMKEAAAEMGIRITDGTAKYTESFVDDNGASGDFGYSIDGATLDIKVATAAAAGGSVEPYGQRFYRVDDEGNVVVSDATLSGHTQYLGAAQLLLNPGLEGLPTPWAGLAVYGTSSGEPFTIALDLAVSDDES